MEETSNWMKQAIALAEQASTQGEVPVGAVLVHEGRAIGSGANRREQTGRTLAHAEILALEDYSTRTGQWRVPPGSTLYVTVEPCLMCTGALIWARVDEIQFGCPDPKNAGLLSIADLIETGRFDHRFKKIDSSLYRNDCARLMKDFFRQRRQSGVDSSVGVPINGLIGRPGACEKPTPHTTQHLSN